MFLRSGRIEQLFPAAANGDGDRSILEDSTSYMIQVHWRKHRMDQQSIDELAGPYVKSCRHSYIYKFNSRAITHETSTVEVHTVLSELR